MSKQFNADKWLEAHEPPSIIINGKTYTGRILSIMEWLPFAERHTKLVESNDGAEFMSFAEDFLRAIFPTNKLLVWVTDPVPLIMGHPAFLEILKRFLAQQMEILTPPSK